MVQRNPETGQFGFDADEAAFVHHGIMQPTFRTDSDPALVAEMIGRLQPYTDTCDTLGSRLIARHAEEQPAVEWFPDAQSLLAYDALNSFCATSALPRHTSVGRTREPSSPLYPHVITTEKAWRALGQMLDITLDSGTYPSV